MSEEEVQIPDEKFEMPLEVKLEELSNRFDRLEAHLASLMAKVEIACDALIKAHAHLLRLDDAVQKLSKPTRLGTTMQ